MLSMKKFLLAGAAALPLVAGAAFAQTAPSPAPTTPANPPVVQNSPTAATPSTNTPAVTPGASSKTVVGDKTPGVGAENKSDAAHDKNATLGNKSAESHDKLDKTHKSAIEKKNAKAHEAQKGASADVKPHDAQKSAKADDKAVSGTSNPTAKKPVDDTAKTPVEAPSKKL
jgi:hypothetical protein